MARGGGVRTASRVKKLEMNADVATLDSISLQDTKDSVFELQQPEAYSSNSESKPSCELPVICLETTASSSPNFFLLDSGSTVNILHERCLDTGLKLAPPTTSLTTLGSRVPVVGILKNIQVKKGSATLCNTNFAVVSGKMDSFDGILGTPFLRSVQAELNFKTDEIVTPVHRVKFMRRAWTHHHSYQVNDELEPSKDLVQECFAAMLSEVNKGNIQLSASSTQTIPACTTAYLRVACPVKFVNNVMVVEPITLPSGLAIGGACIQSESRNDHYLPVMNLSESDVTVRRGDVVTYGLHVRDPRMLIGLEEEWTEEEYYSLDIPSPKEVTPIVEGEKRMPQQCRDCRKQKAKCICVGTKCTGDKEDPHWTAKCVPMVAKCARDEESPTEKIQSKQRIPDTHTWSMGCKTGIRGLLTKEKIMERMRRPPPHTFDLLRELELDRFRRVSAQITFCHH